MDGEHRSSQEMKAKRGRRARCTKLTLHVLEKERMDGKYNYTWKKQGFRLRLLQGRRGMLQGVPPIACAWRGENDRGNRICQRMARQQSQAKRRSLILRISPAEKITVFNAKWGQAKQDIEFQPPPLLPGAAFFLSFTQPRCPSETINAISRCK